MPPQDTIPKRIHILGASGSGTTTLAAAIAAKHGHRHLDTDDFYWLPTDPPYTQKRPREARLAVLRSTLADSRSLLLSGSLCGWGNPLIPEFDLVIFLVVPSEIRMERLRARGHTAIAPGGKLYQGYVDFLDWAQRYDSGGLEMRSRALHEDWFSKLSGRVLRLEGDQSVFEQLASSERRQA